MRNWRDGKQVSGESNGMRFQYCSPPRETEFRAVGGQVGEKTSFSLNGNVNKEKLSHHGGERNEEK